MTARATSQTDRLRRVGMVARSLTDDVHVGEITDIVVRQGMAEMGAVGGAVVFARDGFLTIAASVGSTRRSLPRSGTLTLDRRLPLCEAIRQADEVWITSRRDGLHRFPDLAFASSSSQAWASLPLFHRGTPFGALSLSFSSPVSFDASDREFVRTLTDIAAQALGPFFSDGGNEANQAPLLEIVESVPTAPGTGVLAVDQLGTIVHVTDQLCQLFGYAPHQLLDHGVELLLPVALRLDHMRRRDRYAFNPEMRPMGSGLDLVARHADGAEFPVDVSLSPCATPYGLFTVAGIRRLP